MLALCEAQMEAATQDADNAVDELVQAFNALSSTIVDLNKASQADGVVVSATRSMDDIKQHCSAVSDRMASAVVAFQFYDKLSQRLGHVRYSLSTMALFICDSENSQHPERWEKLLATLGRLYRTAEEREIFDSIAGSLSLTTFDPALPLVKDMSDAGSVELF
jgi:phage-related minor tail protein